MRYPGLSTGGRAGPSAAERSGAGARLMSRGTACGGGAGSGVEAYIVLGIRAWAMPRSTLQPLLRREAARTRRQRRSSSRARNAHRVSARTKPRGGTAERPPRRASRSPRPASDGSHGDMACSPAGRGAHSRQRLAQPPTSPLSPAHLQGFLPFKHSPRSNGAPGEPRRPSRPGHATPAQPPPQVHRAHTNGATTKGRRPVSPSAELSQ